MRNPLALALLLSVTGASAAEFKAVEGIPYLAPTIGVELGPLKSPVLPTTGPKLDAGLEAVFMPPLIQVEGLQSALQAPVAVSMALPTVSQAISQGMVPALTAQNEVIAGAISRDASGLGAREGVDKIYFGGRNRGSGGSSSFGDNSGDGAVRVTAAGMTIGPAGTRGMIAPSSHEATFIVNDERIPITGRAADYYLESKRLEAHLKSKGVNLEESMDVMDDAYAEVYSKLKIIEQVGAAKHIEQHNTHLPETLTWVDGFMKQGDKKIAVHSSRVFFHKAGGEMKSASEISEGIRRIDKSIDQQISYFAKGGKADAEFEGLDEVVLGFDTRGYPEIRRHIQAKEAAIKAQYGDRFKFAFLSDADATQSKDSLRKNLTSLVKKYKGDGLQNIIEGVTYSRYTGLLLELKTIEHRVAQGATILQSGRDLFNDGVDDPARKGMYETEFDVVSRMPDGRLIMDEAKSGRITLDQQEVLDDKFLYKLETYARVRNLMVRKLGGIPEVVFSVDVGGIDRQAALEGQVMWKNPRQLELVRFLQGKEAELSAKYGFKVSFLFMSSYPGVDPHLMINWLAENNDPANDKALVKADKRMAQKADKRRRR